MIKSPDFRVKNYRTIANEYRTNTTGNNAACWKPNPTQGKGPPSATASRLLKQKITEGNHAQQTLEKGAHTCLEKPLDLDRLLALLREIIDKKVRRR